jgi:hypothetical protein
VADWREQEARNETVFREMNEWTKNAFDAGGGARPPLEAYLCECSDRRCTDPISLSRAEYESVRSVAERFAIALNHENPEIDAVISENLRFATVAKFYRPAVAIARATDPRR